MRILSALVIVLLILLLAWWVCTSRSAYKTTPSIYDGIYLDNNSTTRPHPQVLRALCHYSALGNPSSKYAEAAQNVLRNASDKVVLAAGAHPDTYGTIFTSGASESNNLFLAGIVDAHLLDGDIPHLILSTTEHKTSLLCAQKLARLRRAEITLLEPNANGTIDPAQLAGAVRPNTIGVSIIHAHNEIGCINDIARLAQAVRQVAQRRIFFHTDATQSFGKLDVRMQEWGIHAISVSFHKLYGPAGVGALIIHKDLHPALAEGYQVAGTQQSGLRGGTENVAGIAAAAVALDITQQNRMFKNMVLRKMKNLMLNTLLQQFNLGTYSDYYRRPDTFVPPLTEQNQNQNQVDMVVLGPTDAYGWPTQDTAPGTLLLSFVRYAPMEQHLCNLKLRDALQEQKVIVSLGSACSNEAGILHAIHAPYIIRCGTIRISIGDYNTPEDIVQAAHAIQACIYKQFK